MENYYDVMYSESYGWWTLAIAFDVDRKGIEEIKAYEFTGTDEMGVTVQSKRNRVILSIHCHLDPGFSYDDGCSDYDYYDSYENEETQETLESGDYLLDLLTKNREYLKDGDYRLLYGVWQKYGFEPEDDEEFDEDTPPEPPEMDELPQPVRSVLSILEE